jgi:GntR family transcriptional regulator, transcriptional repressor for pyruvate dehydrogenase complex
MPRKKSERGAAAKPGASPASADATAIFEPVEREPAYTRVSAAIEAKILSRSLRDGDLLPVEIDLAQQFKVHRSTVREALRHLESAGLITRPPGAKRMQVSRPHVNKVSSGMRQALVMHDVSFFEVWEAMMVIEPEAAALAAQRRTQADIDALTQARERFMNAPEGDPNAVVRVAEFFELVGACARNRVLMLAKHPLAQVLAPSLAKVIERVPQARSRIWDAQRNIIGALKDKDPSEARRWMAKHVRDFKRGYEVAGITPETLISF